MEINLFLNVLILLLWLAPIVVAVLILRYLRLIYREVHSLAKRVRQENDEESKQV